MRAHPTKALQFDRGAFWLWTNMGRITCAVRFTECVTARNQCDGFFIIHAHARKGFANITARRDWIWISVWTFWVHIDQTHLHRRKWVFQIALTRIAFVTQPFCLNTPIDVFFWFKDIGATTGKTECFKTHRLKRSVARKNQQIGPRNLLAVFLFNWPQ